MGTINARRARTRPTRRLAIANTNAAGDAGAELLPPPNERQQDLLSHVLRTREATRPRDAVGNEPWRQHLKGFRKVHT